MADNSVIDGKTIFEWIKARHADGLTVYATTYLRSTKIAPKHADLVRLRGDHCEVLMGKQGWVSINGCRITARKQ